MACGTPVLTSHSSSLAEIAEGAARLVDPTDEAALTAGLLALATDRDLAADLAARGRARAASFSWDRTGRETAAAYREAFEDARGTSVRVPGPRATRLSE
jgi:glycosyltransferase involved in cell wall biosynthesis